MRKPEPSRRALLAGGAIAFVATVAAIGIASPMADATPDSMAADWRAAMRKVDAARADEAHADAIYKAADDAERGPDRTENPPYLDALEDEAEAAFNVMRDAEAEALALPAPDAAAFQFKAALWTEGLQDDLISPQSLKRRVLWAFLMADAVRLAGDVEGGAAWRTEAAAIQARGDLAERIEAAGGWAYIPNHGDGYGPISWAPNPPADVDRAALAIERAAIEVAFARLAPTFTGRDFRGVRDFAKSPFYAWGGLYPFRRGGEACTPAEQAAERDRRARVASALDLCSAAPVLMRWKGRDEKTGAPLIQCNVTTFHGILREEAEKIHARQVEAVNAWAAVQDDAFADDFNGRKPLGYAALQNRIAAAGGWSIWLAHGHDATPPSPRPAHWGDDGSRADPDMVWPV